MFECPTFEAYRKSYDAKSFQSVAPTFRFFAALTDTLLKERPLSYESLT